MMARQQWIVYLGCLLCGLVCVGMTHAKYQADLATAQKQYVTEADFKTLQVANRFNNSFRTLYEGLRTMARLPGVRKIDRYAEHFDTDARQTVQEIYNNLVSRIAMSEVYIVPLNLEPDQIDQHTGQLQAPSTTFDEMIVGKTAMQPDMKAVNALKVPEVEIYEYRLMKRQLAWLRRHYPREQSISGLQFPAICGPEVITCDNSHYSPLHPDDKDRSGLVYSVPYYGPDGKLKGCVSGVMLTSALQALLPSGDYAMRQPANGYTVSPQQSGQSSLSREWIASERPDPRLRYSNVMNCSIVDSSGGWRLWAGSPDSLFWHRSDVRSAQRFASLGYAVSFLLAFVLWLFTFLAGRHNRIIEEKNQALEKLVDERTRSLCESQEQLRRQNDNLEEIVNERTQELVYQAFHDPLTGLPNRANVLCYLNQIASREQSPAPQHGTDDESSSGTAVLFLDLDNFKFINDSLGHRAGDELLIAVTKRLRGCVGPADLVARLGGDEFIVVLEALDGPDAAILIAQKILAVMCTGFSLEAGEGFTTASVGIAYTKGKFDPDILIRDADTAMYHAKAAGKANYALFEPGMNDRLTERVEMEVGLRIALVQKEFCVHYQPLIDLKTGHLAGVEALVRWQHPKYGLVSPGKFIPIAEDTGLIVPIGYWVLEEACRQTVQWMQEYPTHRPFTINVNLSGKQLQKPDVVECVQEILERTGMPRGALKLEITESVMMADAHDTIAKLTRLRALGVKLAMDDFGTGYSSMASLSSFPLDTVKIDRAFINRINNEPESESVVAAIIMLAKSLQLDVTGEGIENPQQVTTLQGLGCDIGQGYFFSKPLIAGALEAKMTEPVHAFVRSYTDEDISVIERLLAQHIADTPSSLPEAA